MNTRAPIGPITAFGRELAQVAIKTGEPILACWIHCPNPLRSFVLEGGWVEAERRGTSAIEQGFRIRLTAKSWDLLGGADQTEAMERLR